KGSPGTDVTFFEIGLAPKYTAGTNSISRTILRVPSTEAISFFRERFKEYGVYHEGVIEYFGHTCMKFSDSEDQRFALLVDPDYQDSEPNKHRSEEHTSELQSRFDLVCRLLLEKKKI